jgi:nucleoside-diphosphate-sugar epimerase
MSLSGQLLLVQNKGGGHGTIGYHVCKQLVDANPSLSITLLQDKTDMSKAPFSSYSDLEKLGVKVVEMKLSKDTPIDVSKINPTGSPIDYVIDNWSKNPDTANSILSIAKSSQSKQYVFISSAGMYKSSGVIPHVESDPVKSSSDIYAVETLVKEAGIPYTFIRPQYIYGPKSNKRYLDYFIGRAFRKLPIPVPLSGEQLVCLTNIVDVAALIALTVGHTKAANQVFNCGSDRYITYKGLCGLIHKHYSNADDEIKYLHYDPEDFTHWDGTGPMEFPFRANSFITTPSKAKVLLGWSPQHRLEADIAAELEEYKNIGGTKEKWGMDQLRYDLEVIASKDTKFMFTYPFFDDETINPEQQPYGFMSGSEFAEAE